MKKILVTTSMALVSMQALASSAQMVEQEKIAADAKSNKPADQNAAFINNKSFYVAQKEETLNQKLATVFDKKPLREAINDSYGLLIKNYGDDIKTIHQKYFNDIEKDLIRVSTRSANGNSANQDSTGNGTGTSTSYGTPGGSDFVANCQNPNTQEDGCICHSQCHGNCHGSRGWR